MTWSGGKEVDAVVFFDKRSKITWKTISISGVLTTLNSFKGPTFSHLKKSQWGKMTLLRVSTTVCGGPRGPEDMFIVGDLTRF